jgi:hypothetical protein
VYGTMKIRPTVDEVITLRTAAGLPPLAGYGVQNSARWSCATCTLDNEPFAEACAVCGSARPPQPDPSVPSAPSAAAAAAASTNQSPSIPLLEGSSFQAEMLSRAAHLDSLPDAHKQNILAQLESAYAQAIKKADAATAEDFSEYVDCCFQNPRRVSSHGALSHIDTRLKGFLSPHPLPLPFFLTSAGVLRMCLIVCCV